jgi:hypothetical protein
MVHGTHVRSRTHTGQGSGKWAHVQVPKWNTGQVREWALFGHTWMLTTERPVTDPNAAAASDDGVSEKHLDRADKALQRQNGH